MIAPARLAAYDCLCAVSAGRADLATSLEQARAGLDDSRDRALLTDIATGVQRWRAALDHLITTFSRRRLDQLDPEVVEILRLSAYQLIHLTRVPAAAIVDDGVNLVGKVGKKSARGFANAVLRSISRNRRALPWPARPDTFEDRAAALDYLAITLSHPRWLVSRWLDRLGFEDTERWLRYNNTTGSLTLRANRLRTTAAGLQSRLSELGVAVAAARYAPDALVLGRGDREAQAALDTMSGDFLIQDEASQLVTLLAGERPGPLILDTCASPGGKTTALAAIDTSATVIACDVRERRMQLLARTVAGAGAANVRLVQADLLAPLPFRASFSCVFVDAPCSGLGTLRRDPDLKWRRSAGDLPELARLQGQMLDRAASVVAAGGRLVYATCTSEPEENDEVAAAFAERSRFRRVDAHGVHPTLPLSVVDDTGALRTNPATHELDAFYGVVFERPA